MSDFLINDITLEHQRGVKIAPTKDGGWVAIWNDFGREEAGLWGQKFSENNERIGPAFRIGVAGFFADDDYAISGLTDGGWIVTYEDKLYKKYSSNGQVVAQGQLGYGEAILGQVQTAPFTNGGWIATWVERHDLPSGEDIYLQRFDANGQKTGPQIVANTRTEGGQENPTVSILPDGGWVVFYTSTGLRAESDDWLSIVGQRFNAGGAKVGNEIIITPETYHTPSWSDFLGSAPLSGGGWVVSWGENSTEIKYLVFDKNGQPTSLPKLASPDGRAIWGSVTPTKSGGFFITSDKVIATGGYTDVDVKASFFDASGNPLGTQFLVNDYQRGWQENSVSTTLENGTVVAGWSAIAIGGISSGSSDRSGDGVYAKFYSEPGITSPNPNDNTTNSSTGIHTVKFAGKVHEYSITLNGSNINIIDSVLGRDGTHTLANIERIKFSDTNIAFDINGNAGQAYRIYQAAFDRKPDTGGLGFWITQIDNGATLKSVAQGFIASAEFQTLYGSSPTNAAFIDSLYHNILHRAGEQGGVDFWNGVLNSGTSKSDVLVGFSESAENKAGVIGSIQNGIQYAEWIG